MYYVRFYHKDGKVPNFGVEEVNFLAFIFSFVVVAALGENRAWSWGG
jgi:hypothetical protein